jgi:hypothetical protein
MDPVPPLWKGSVRRGWRDTLMSAVALAIIVLVLINFDSHLREEVQLRVSSPSAMIEDTTHGAKNLASGVMDALRGHSLDRAPLLIFVFGAGVLLVFMLKT